MPDITFWKPFSAGFPLFAASYNRNAAAFPFEYAASMSGKTLPRLFHTCLTLLACAAMFAMVWAKLSEPGESVARAARQPAPVSTAVEPDIDVVNKDASQAVLAPVFTAVAQVDSHAATPSPDPQPNNATSNAAIAAVFGSTPELEVSLEAALIDADAVQRQRNAQDALELLRTIAERREEAASSVP